MRWGSWTLVVSSFPPRLRSEGGWGEIELINKPGYCDSESWGYMFGQTILVHIDNSQDEYNDYDPKGLMEALAAIYEEWQANPSMTAAEAAYLLAAKEQS